MTDPAQRASPLATRSADSATPEATPTAVEVALLDSAGYIIAVNDPWLEFCVANDGDPDRTGVGASYLAVCEAADDPESARVAAAIRSAIAGDLPAPTTVRIPCDATGMARRFDVLISSRSEDGRCVGATVTLSPSTEPDPSAPPAPFDRQNLARHGGWNPSATALNEPGLDFPDIAQMELEQLIGQLTARAQGVLAVQGRLRGLLRANATVVGDLSLPVVLRHIVTAARELVQAGYGALGVIGRDGGLEQFVHVGMDPGVVDEIGGLPEGRGILGLLINFPDPVRLADLGAHPAAVGFPAHHPPMGSFLGVPIRVRGQIFGNLYLTDSANGEFSAEDEQLATALAATAGVAIANARLFHETEQQRLWLTASTELTQTLFAGATEPPLDLVLRYAMRGTDADMATLAMPVDDHRATVQAAAGALSGMVGQSVDLGHTLVGRVIHSGKAVLLDDYTAEFDRTDEPEFAGSIGAVIGVPLLAADSRVLAALTVARVTGRAAFDESDRDQLAGFASHAGLALELDRARAEHESLRRMEDHERIAADLHDHVIQELFATGMGLQAMLGTLPRPEQRARVGGYVDALDGTIRRIRTTIFQLQSDRKSTTGLKTRLLSVLEGETPALGFHAGIEFEGQLDLLVPPAMADDMVAVVREALSNVARHARASSVHVRVSLVGALVSIEVTDNGRGIGSPTRISGLSNLRHRAETHGGTLEITDPPTGTRLRWTALLD